MDVSAVWSDGQFEPWDVCGTMEVPLLGSVAAGEPYEAVPQAERLRVPLVLWGGRQVFALRVRGSSMIDEGIHNADYLIVEPRAAADNGQTVVAEVDGGVTVKKFFRQADGSIRLQPANPEMLPLTLRGDNVRIIGVVVGVFRKLGFGASRASVAPAPEARPVAPVPAPPAASTTPRDEESLELALNALDAQLQRWRVAIERARHDKRLRARVPQMAELGRDLQALRDSCARTRKPGLRRALIVEANRVMRRMQRFSALSPVAVPDSLLH